MSRPKTLSGARLRDRARGVLGYEDRDRRGVRPLGEALYRGIPDPDARRCLWRHPRADAGTLQDDGRCDGASHSMVPGLEPQGRMGQTRFRGGRIVDRQVSFDGREVVQIKSRWGDLEMDSLPD